MKIGGLFKFVSHVLFLAFSQLLYLFQQDQLVSLSETLSHVPNYSETRMWFAQAIPVLSRYLEIPQSRTFNVRMKVVLDQPGIARILGSAGSITQGHKYLGHDSASLSDPIHMGLEPRKEALNSEYGSGRVEKGRVVVDMTSYTTQVIFS